MLRRLLLALAFAVLAVFAACAPASAAPSSTPAAEAAPSPEPSAEAAPSPTPAAEAAPSPDPSAEVKYYVVRDEFGGQPEFLFEIAQRFLGSGDRNDEIFRLNKGRLQPDGLRLTKPEAILPGWILQLPSDAEGEGVQVGPLPTVAPRAAANADALTPASDGPPWWKWASLASGLVLLLAGGVMAVWWLTRRRRRATASGPPSPGWPDTDRYYRLEDSAG